MSEPPEVFAIFEQKLAHVLSFTLVAQPNNVKKAVEELLIYFSSIVERASNAELESTIDKLEAKNCPACMGLGYFVFRGIGNRVCSKCNGTGKILKEKK